jgi:hypothetical protein
MPHKNANNFKLIFKKYKYKIKAIFKKPLSIVVNFKGLDEITNVNLLFKENIKTKEYGFSYPPKKIGELQKKKEILYNDIQILNLKNISISLKTTLFFNRKLNTIYYEKWHSKTDKICMYSNHTIKKHSKTNALIRNLNENKSIEKFIYIGGTFVDNYYHFLIEIISKVEYIKFIPNSLNYPIIFDNSIQNIQSFQTIIKIILKDFQVIYADDKDFYFGKDIWYITSPNITSPNITFDDFYKTEYTKTRPNSINYLKNKLLEKIDYDQIKIKTYNKVFISRKSKTRPYNQDEISDIAIKYGFECVFFEELNLYEQMYLMQNANYIIGPTGAAWTNLIFAKENSKGLIWMNSIWNELSVFSNISNIVNNDLSFYIYEKGSNDFHDNYTLDPLVFENQLIKFLN